ncbi:hypothetical protein QAD02_024376 [Eretmocerus hayati]|uniref:Uncharacterized protein n=1 Tax=Eretmocerus hayati TaxID=131215 RepID=A0ACC2PYF7_9HYME|nr:hypothetical protein QAD02_024376 [Eretmocerus hayati]
MAPREARDNKLYISRYAVRDIVRLLSGKRCVRVNPRLHPLLELKDSGALVCQCCSLNHSTNQNLRPTLENFREYHDIRLREEPLPNCWICSRQFLVTRPIYECDECTAREIPSDVESTVIQAALRVLEVEDPRPFNFQDILENLQQPFPTVAFVDSTSPPRRKTRVGKRRRARFHRKELQKIRSVLERQTSPPPRWEEEVPTYKNHKFPVKPELRLELRIFKAQRECPETPCKIGGICNICFESFINRYKIPMIRPAEEIARRKKKILEITPNEEYDIYKQDYAELQKKLKELENHHRLAYFTCEKRIHHVLIPMEP